MILDLKTASDTTLLTLPRLNTRVGERAFAYVGAAAWNQLPESIRQLQITSLKHKQDISLRTEL